MAERGNSRDSPRRWTRGCHVTATLQRAAHPPASGASADESGWLLRRRQRGEPLAPRRDPLRCVASRRIASRRACMGKPRTTEDKAHGLSSPTASLIHSVHFAPVDVPPSIPSRTLLPLSLSRPPWPRRLPRSRIARRERDRGRGGEKERGRRGKREGEVERARVRPARKSRRARKRERAAEEEVEEEEEEEVEEEEGKEDYYYYSWGPPTTRPAAATPVRSQSALDRRPLDFAIHERR